MKKSLVFAVMAFCLVSFAFVCGSVQAGGGTPNPSGSMLEEMKNSVSEIRVFLMPTNYQVTEWDLRDLRRGNQPDWEEISSWFSIPVVNREYDAVVQAPVGEYKIFFLALGGDWVWVPIFFSASDEVVYIREGERATPEIRMEPLGLYITVHADGITPEEIGSAEMSFVVDGKSGTDNIVFWRDWETGNTVSEVFLPYGATDVLLVANTDKQLVAPIVWGNVVDGKVTVRLEPKLAGGILAPVIVWPEEDLEL